MTTKDFAETSRPDQIELFERRAGQCLGTFENVDDRIKIVRYDRAAALPLPSLIASISSDPCVYLSQTTSAPEPFGYPLTKLRMTNKLQWPTA